MELKDEKCEPCREGTSPLSPEMAKELLRETPKWRLKGRSIEQEFKFEDFRKAIRFINRVADVAEEQGHHPDIYNSYNKVRLELWTHKIGGLSKNDFILAAKIDALVK